MIALCTAKPQYRLNADQVFISFPSRPDETVEIALTRNQLCELYRTTRTAMDASFYRPESSAAEIVPIRAKVAGCQNVR